MIRIVRLMLPVVFTAVLTAANSIPAHDLALELDPAQTKVEFTLGDVLHTVHGTFQLKHGAIRFDPGSGKVSGEIVLDAASGASGSGARDRKMNKQVLESETYPEIVFRPDHAEGQVARQGTSHIQLHGIFAIHGGEHEMTIPMDLDAADGRFIATAQWVVPYVKWGMKDPSTLFLRVSDKVQISIHTIAHPPSSGSSPS
jgi:polyisoprenoid-binding protein YceI